MQMMIEIWGAGIGVPKTNLEIGAFNGARISFRRALGLPSMSRLSVRDLISLGSKSGTFLASLIITDWFELDPKEDNWAYNTNCLIGKTVEIEVSGLTLGRGEVDIAVRFFDKYNKSKELVTRCCVKSTGGQISPTKVRGVVCNAPFVDPRKKTQNKTRSGSYTFP